MAISHLFFNDDLFLFSEASEAQAYLMDTILQEFHGISGQKVNIEKSKSYVSKNTNKAIELAISSKWGIPLTIDLGKYLGFRLFMDEGKKKPTLERVQKSGVVSRLREEASIESCHKLANSNHDSYYSIVFYASGETP